MSTAKAKIEAAINNKAAIVCNYKGEQRDLIPLAIGVFKNGRQALFCDRLFIEDGKVVKCSFRAYKVDFIDGVSELDIKQPFINKDRVYYQSGRIMDYFKSISAERTDWKLNRKVI